jgi:hypothetical protein
LRNQLSHHLTVGLLYDRRPDEAEEIQRALTDIQARNPNIKIALVNDSSVIPENLVYGAISPIVVLRHPIFEDFVGLFHNVIINHKDDGVTIDEDQTENNLRHALRSSKLDFIDAMNVELYSTFDRGIIGIVTNHPSVDDLSKNKPFYKALAKFLYEGGLSKHPEFDYAIINALEIRDVAHDFQLNTFFPDRNFFLVLLKDVDTGYIYEDIIIRENEDMPLVKTADTIHKFIEDYKNKNI